MDVIVVGGGVSGLSSALVLARRGHHVTIIERDDTPVAESAAEAFEWDRRGAPQVRQSHAFLARLHQLLMLHGADVLDDLLAAGATEIRFGEAPLPRELVGFEPEPDDAEIVMLACRRTTFEWVLRRAVRADDRVEIRTGVAAGLVSSRASATPAGGERPIVSGVLLVDGSTIDADLVVVAAGRRSTVAEWFAGVGAEAVRETSEDTGIVYFSRFYALRDGHELPPDAGLIGGDLGYLKYGVFIGDNRTFSITLAVSTEDTDLRRSLGDPASFETAAGNMTIIAPWLDGRAEPITPTVHVMAGLLNRWRDYVVDGEPLAENVVAVGDAVLCTNPLYGRGCTTAFWGSVLLADALDEEPTDMVAMATRYDESLRDEIFPWYRAAVVQDREARRIATSILAGEDPDVDPDDPRTFVRALLRDGLAPAMRRDPVVLRAFMRTFNMLAAPDSLRLDEDVAARVLTVWNDRDEREPEPDLGPRTRRELLELLPP